MSFDGITAAFDHATAVLDRVIAGIDESKVGLLKQMHFLLKLTSFLLKQWFFSAPPHTSCLNDGPFLLHWHLFCSNNCIFAVSILALLPPQQHNPLLLAHRSWVLALTTWLLVHFGLVVPSPIGMVALFAILHCCLICTVGPSTILHCS